MVVSGSSVYKIFSIIEGRKKVKASIYIAHHAYTPLMRFPSLTRAAGRTATACSLQTQANAAARPGSPSQLYKNHHLP